MIRETVLYIYARTKVIYPICDRCNDVEQKSIRLNFLTYMRNSKNGFVYCDQCWNWIHLKRWTDSDGHSHTLRTTNKEVN